MLRVGVARQIAATGATDEKPLSIGQLSLSEHGLNSEGYYEDPSPMSARPDGRALAIQAVLMSGSVDPEAAKTDGALIRPATGRAQGGFAPAFFTEEALLRLEEGLIAQREQQEGQRFSEPDAASSRPGSSSGRQGSTQIDPVSENAPLVPGDPVLTSGDEARIQNELLLIGDPRRSGDGFSDSADRGKIRTEEPVPSPSWRRRKVGLLLCALLLVVGAAALVSLKSRTGGSTDGAPVRIEARGRTASVPPDNDEPRQPIANAVKSSAATPPLPPPSPAPLNERPVEAQGPATPAAPPNEQPVEAQGPAAPAASETAHRLNNRSKGKGLLRRRPARRHSRSKMR